MLCSIELGSVKCNLETAKIRRKKVAITVATLPKILIRTPLKLDTNFRFVTETNDS